MPFLRDFRSYFSTHCQNTKDLYLDSDTALSITATLYRKTAADSENDAYMFGYEDITNDSYQGEKIKICIKWNPEHRYLENIGFHFSDRDIPIIGVPMAYYGIDVDDIIVVPTYFNGGRKKVLRRLVVNDILIKGKGTEITRLLVMSPERQDLPS